MSNKIKKIMNEVLKNRNEGDMIESYVIEDDILGTKLTGAVNGCMYHVRTQMVAIVLRCEDPEHME